MRYASGEVRPRLQDRKVTGRAKEIYDDVRLHDFEARGLMALAGDVMEGMAELDATRKRLAKDDPALNTLLAQIELDAAVAVRDIVNSVHRPTRRLSW